MTAAGWGGVAAGSIVVVLAATASWAARGAERARVLARVRGGTVAAAAPTWFVDGCRRLDLSIEAARVWPFARVVAVGAAIVIAVRSPGWAVAGLVLGGATVAWRCRAGRRRPPVDGVAIVDALVAPLLAGASVAQAVGQVVERGAGSEVATELAPVAGAIERGAGSQAAFDAWASSLGQPSLLLVADALAVAGSSGGSQARALTGVGDTLRERAALDREIHAAGAQARASAVVLAITPVAFTSVVALLDRRVGAFLLGSPVGIGCLVVGSLADAVGWRWMRHLVEEVTR